MDVIYGAPCIGRSEAYFYQLLWQPAAVMHASWWSALGIEILQPIYQTIPRTRCSINRLVMQRRMTSSNTSVLQSALCFSDLTPIEQKILACSEKLPALICVLGLLRLGRAEYWMLRDYRNALPELHSIDRVQLNVLAAPLMNSSTPDCFRLNLPLLAPAHIAQQATLHGAAVLMHALEGRSLLKVFEVLFEPSTFEESPTIDETAASFGLNILFRLARFL